VKEVGSVKTDDLTLTIARLARSGTPVAPLASPVIRLARWLLAALAASLAVIVFIGVRADAVAQLADAWFLARAGLALVVVTMAGLAALMLGVPGAARPLATRLAVAAGLAGWGLVSLAMLMATGAPIRALLDVEPHVVCALRTLAIGLAPAALLVMMLRRASPLQPRQAASFAVLAGAALGVVGTQFVCPDDSAAHHIVWHAVPVLMFAALGLALPRPLLVRPHRFAQGTQRT
jgi:hypothetical protein